MRERYADTTSPGDIIKDLVETARLEAAAAGYVSVVEIAAGSESTYIHIRRSGFWYGVRVSMHYPAYACSRDYAQCLLPKALDEPGYRRAAEFIRTATCTGGLVVAEPSEIRREIVLLESTLADGSSQIDEQGNRWTWNSRERGWQCGNLESGVPKTSQIQQFASMRRPARAELSAGRIADLRHRFNQREKWSAEQCGVSISLTRSHQQANCVVESPTQS